MLDGGNEVNRLLIVYSFNKAYFFLGCILYIQNKVKQREKYGCLVEQGFFFSRGFSKLLDYKIIAIHFLLYLGLTPKR